MSKIPDASPGRWIAGIATTFLCSGLLQAAPTIPGVDRLTADSDADHAFAGEILLSELACTQCHQAEANQTRIWNKQAPDLSRVGARVTPQYIERFIKSPHATKKGTTMPDIFHSSEAGARDGAVDYLTHFLTSLGGPIAPSKSGGSDKAVAWGKELFHSIGCVACHGPQDGTDNTEFKPLGDLASKTTVDVLTGFLLNPHEARPSGRMPSLWLSQDEARAISVFLIRAQLDNPTSKNAPPSSIPGLNVDYYEIDGINRLPDFSTLKADNRAVINSIKIDDLPFKRRSEHYALRFAGQITIGEAGNYTFSTRSDDGSRLLINNKLVVDNDGVHGPQSKTGNANLDAGSHDFEVQFFNGGLGDELQVGWKKTGRRGRGRSIPSGLFSITGGQPMVPLKSAAFTIDRTKARVGKRMFQAMRCASCHTLENAPSMSQSKSLAELDTESTEGCLSTSIKAGFPDYKLTDTQRKQLVAAIKNRSSLSQPDTSANQIKKTLATFNCYACHQRDGIGGPNDVISANYFASISDIDLGEEGKIPPSLNHVGAKLKPSAIESILGSQDLHVRHYMKTRMPNFGTENLSAFINHIAEADQHPTPDANPQFSEEDAKIGRKFVGTSGLACITCHQIDGQRALAIQGIDLSTVYDRINPSWFEAFLLQPASFNQDTRMPQFWPEGESLFVDILGGDSKKQIKSIWSYLSQKNSITLPVGIPLPGDIPMELIPDEYPIVHRTFMKDVGPRAILTGFPEKLSTAFDANVMRLAKVWRGRFFDHSGVESGRSYDFLSPLGEDILDLPAGPAFALLETKTSAWPSVEKSSRDTGGRFLGYHLGKDRRPTFRYQLGTATIEEKPEPVLKPGGATLKRSFKITSDSNTTLYFLAAQGIAVEDKGENTYQVDGNIIHLTGSPQIKPFIRTADGQNQIIVPITSQSASLTQTIEW
jgi:mono/diheme cytochrome c family protein